MSIWSKVLIGVVAVVSLVLFYLSARVLDQNRQQRREIAQLEEQLARELERTPRLRDGTDDEPGVRQLRLELNAQLLRRGRAWRDAQPVQRNPETGEISVAISEPVPHGIDDKTRLFAFDARPFSEGGRYLGQFKVLQVAENQVVIAPATRLTAAQRERVDASPGPWILYDVLPSDDHDVFADVPEDELDQWLPASTVDEYRKDGRPADPNDPVERVIGGKYVRSLRDYATLFHDFERQQTILLELITAARTDQSYLAAALADAAQQIAAREQEQSALQTDLAALRRERDAVATHLDSVETRLAAVRAEIAELSQANRRLAAELAAMQVEALEAAGVVP